MLLFCDFNLVQTLDICVPHSTVVLISRARMCVCVTSVMRVWPCIMYMMQENSGNKDQK